MQQAKFSLTSTLVKFLGDYQAYGFKDKSSMVRIAIQRFKEELELQSLKKSADLYTEIYEHDEELQQLTSSALQGWPE